MRTSKIPASAVKTIVRLLSNTARIIISSDVSFFLDGKNHEHTYIQEKAFTILREKGWITIPQERGYQLAECTITEEGRQAATNFISLQCTYYQLEFDADLFETPALAHQLEFDADLFEIPTETHENHHENQHTATSQEPEHTTASQEPEHTATSQEPEHAPASQEPEHIATSQEPEYAPASQEPEHTVADEPEHTTANEPEHTATGQEPEYAPANYEEDITQQVQLNHIKKGLSEGNIKFAIPQQEPVPLQELHAPPTSQKQMFQRGGETEKSGGQPMQQEITSVIVQEIVCMYPGKLSPLSALGELVVLLTAASQELLHERPPP